MKVKINNHQFQILTSRFHLIEGQGLVSNKNNLLAESMKEFKVKVFFQGWPSTIRVGANSSASALRIARLMFPKAIITASVTAV